MGIVKPAMPTSAEALCASVRLARAALHRPQKLTNPKISISPRPPLRSVYFLEQNNTARRGARTHNLEIKSLTRYRLCQPGLLLLI